MAASSGVFCDVCSEETPYHTAEELWEGLEQGDEGARLLFVFFLCLRKKERMRCSVEKAIAVERKRWVTVLIEEAWCLYLLMRHRAVPYQGKPKSVIAIEGSRAQRRILARSGLARYSAPSVKKRAAVMLQTTWNKNTSSGLCCGWTTGTTNNLRQTLTRTTRALAQQRWLSCYYGLQKATGMVIIALKSLNGVFLLLRACWEPLREPLHVSCVI